MASVEEVDRLVKRWDEQPLVPIVKYLDTRGRGVWRTFWISFICLWKLRVESSFIPLKVQVVVSTSLVL